MTAGTGPSNSVAVSATTNRITTTGYGYDANGNMTNDGLNSLTYDAENHVVTSSGGLGSGTYTYDGNGLRVEKVSGTTTTVYIFSGTKVIAEYVNGAAPSSPTREYVYSGSALLAKIESGATQYYHPDHLSARMMTDSSGNKIGEQGHYPYGESWYLTNTTTKWQFTSYERDAESGNDYAMARYNINRLGRFSSPDPLGGSTQNPQSLNRFSYVLNGPVGFVDPLGLDACLPGQVDDCPGTSDGSQCQGNYCQSDTTCPNGQCTTVNITVTVNGSATNPDNSTATSPDNSTLDAFNQCVGTDCSLASPGGVGDPSTRGAPDRQPQKPQAPSRLTCAANYGDYHSLASATHLNNPIGNALLGNSVSGLIHLGESIFSNETPDVTGIVLGGGAQGVPIPGVHPGLGGAAGQVQDAAVQSAANGVSKLATGAELSEATAEGAAFWVAVAKFGADALIDAYGFAFKCK